MYLQTNQLSENTLADYPFEGFLNYLLGLWNEESIQAISTKLMNRLNYNEGWTCKIVLASDSCFRYSEVRNILMVYANLVLKNGLVEYSRDANTDYIVSKAVADAIPTSYVRVQKVLRNLSDAVLDGSIKGSALLKPRTSSAQKGYNQAPPQLEKYNIDLIDTVGDSLTTLGKWLILGGIGFGVLYFGVPLAVKKLA
jgi:hypothetical protein